jgi:hypothetical protein
MYNKYSSEFLKKENRVIFTAMYYIIAPIYTSIKKRSGFLNQAKKR